MFLLSVFCYFKTSLEPLSPNIYKVPEQLEAERIFSDDESTGSSLSTSQYSDTDEESMPTDIEIEMPEK